MHMHILVPVAVQETSVSAAQKALAAQRTEGSGRQRDCDVRDEEERMQGACAAWIAQHGRRVQP